jgi:6-phosphogluconolactonase (cycloisomerase 2 family)
MKTYWKIGVGLLAVVLTLGVVWHLSAAAEQKGDPPTAAHYTVVSTDGSHLIVVDNSTSKLYFYAIDKDGKVGDELKLRGSADLHDVGKPGIKPIDAKPQK